MPGNVGKGVLEETRMMRTASQTKLPTWFIWGMFTCVVALQGELQLDLHSTVPMPLISGRQIRLAILPDSEDVVVLGYSPSRSRMLLHIYRDGSQEERPVKNPCQHNLDAGDILGLTIKGEEVIAKSCKACKNIKLINPQTNKVTVAYKTGRRSYRLCAGKPSRLWMRSPTSLNHSQVVELNCEKKRFTQTGASFQVDNFNCFCNLPGSPATLVCCDVEQVRVVSCKDGSTLWEVGEAVAGKRFNPHGVLSYSEFLLVADFNCHRIVVITEGSFRQSIQLPEEVGRPCELGLSQDQLVVLGYHPVERKLKLSRFRITRNTSLWYHLCSKFFLVFLYSVFYHVFRLLTTNFLGHDQSERTPNIVLSQHLSEGRQNNALFPHSPHQEESHLETADRESKLTV